MNLGSLAVVGDGGQQAQARRARAAVPPFFAQDQDIPAQGLSHSTQMPAAMTGSRAQRRMKAAFGNAGGDI